MSQEVLSQAVGLAKQGHFEDAITLVRPLAAQDDR
jgi:hypothetical protein